MTSIISQPALSRGHCPPPTLVSCRLSAQHPSTPATPWISHPRLCRGTFLNTLHRPPTHVLPHLKTQSILHTTIVQAAHLLAKAKQKFANNDRMGALTLWEAVLKCDPDEAQRQTALFNATCIHAGFGDVELAQITLREAVQRGLDFSKAVQAPESYHPDMIPMLSSQQVLVRLKKFDEATRRAMGASVAPPSFSSTGTSSSTPSRKTTFRLDQDVSDLLETEMQGIDTSVFGIIKRVAVLLVVLIGAGVGMYIIGIKYLFPDM